VLVKREIAQKDFCERIHRIPSADASQAASGTDIGTLSTAGATISLYPFGPFQIDGLLRAGLRALPAPDTIFGGKGDFCFRILGFGVVAEAAAEGTPFEENNTADARSVIEAVSFDIDDEGKLFHGYKPSL
jgi:hypothetical protein